MTRVSAILTFLAAASTTLAAAISPDVLFRRDDTIWCGAIQSKVPSGHFTDVYGEWVIPKLSKRNGQAGSTPNNELNVPMWVGIDGVGGICNNGALLQAGTTTFVSVSILFPCSMVLTNHDSFIPMVKSQLSFGSSSSLSLQSFRTLKVSLLTSFKYSGKDNCLTVITVNTGDHVSVQIHADSMTKGTV